ncbi:MAG: glycosyltransferase family 4 protein [Arcticibacter sp.]
MNFVVFTHVTHRSLNGKIYAYGPYVREMNLWVKEHDRLTIVSPFIVDGSPNPIESSFDCSNIRFVRLPAFSFVDFNNRIRSFILLPFLIFQILRGLLSKGHLHFRLPGNVGLLSSLLQIFFPFRKKTFKYAGNWHQTNLQPWSYRLQRWIAKNPLLTRNANVLVYGKQINDPGHVIDFYTASYHEDDRTEFEINSKFNDSVIRLIIVGTLSEGKRPLLAVQVLEELLRGKVQAQLYVCGEGPLKDFLLGYVRNKKLESYVHLTGNIKRADVDQLLQESQFLLMPSKSEGWPKAVAEAMWWGCIPIATEISCIPQMLDHGKRGIIVNPDAPAMAAVIMELLNDFEQSSRMRTEAMIWSRQYTLERMQNDIKRFIA